MGLTAIVITGIKHQSQKFTLQEFIHTNNSNLTSSRVWEQPESQDFYSLYIPV